MNPELSLIQEIRKTARHSGVYSLGSLLKGLVGFLLIPVYTNFFSVADYGRWGLLYVTGQVIRILLGLGLVSAIFRSYFDYSEVRDRKIVISTAFYLLLVSCVIFWGLIVISARRLSVLIFSDPGYDRHIILIGAYAVIWAFQRLSLAVFRARNESFRYVAFELLGFFVHLAMAVFLIVFLNMELMGALLSLLISGCVATLVAGWMIRTSFERWFSFEEARKMLAYGLPTIITVLAIFVINFSDKFFIKIYLDFHAVGLYELGYNFGMLLLVFFATPIRLVWEPMYLSVKDKTNAGDYYSRMLTYFFLLGVLLVLGVSFFSRHVINAIAPAEFWGAYRVVPLVALAYLIFGCERIVHLGIGLSRKTYITALIFSAGAALNVFLNICWIPKNGIMGAAYATLTTILAIFLGVYVVSQRLHRVAYEWDRIGKIALAGGLIYVFGTNLFSGTGFASLTGKIICFLSFPILLWLLGFFLPKEKEGLGKMIKCGCNLKMIKKQRR